MVKLKSYAYKYESEALNILSKQYKYCWRIPMSLAPFDILCIDDDKNIVAFVEVKYGKSRITENQKEFMEIINRLNKPLVKYIILRVSE